MKSHMPAIWLWVQSLYPREHFFDLKRVIYVGTVIQFLPSTPSNQIRVSIPAKLSICGSLRVAVAGSTFSHLGHDRGSLPSVNLGLAFGSFGSFSSFGSSMPGRRSDMVPVGAEGMGCASGRFQNDLLQDCILL